MRPQESPFSRKMSEVILEFAKPLFGYGDDYSDEHFEADVGLAVLCWNISFFPPKKQKKFFNTMLDEVCGSDVNCRLDMTGIVHSMIERKKTFYAHEKRFVQNYQIINEGKGDCLIVASVLAE